MSHSGPCFLEAHAIVLRERTTYSRRRSRQARRQDRRAFQREFFGAGLSTLTTRGDRRAKVDFPLSGVPGFWFSITIPFSTVRNAAGGAGHSHIGKEAHYCLLDIGIGPNTGPVPSKDSRPI
jgi:hypothetical protein